MSTEDSGTETTEAGAGRPWVAIAAGVSLVLGWGTSGDLIYHSLIGLDSSHFPAGEWIQSTLTPGATKAMGGLVVGVGILLILGGLFFVLSRRDAPTRPDGRRAFLAGSAAGASAFAAGLTGALAHTFFGIGKSGGEGWAGVQGGINSDDGIVKTHPTWDDAWKGARVESYGRLGRTEWPISDTVLGAGRIREANWKVVTGAFDGVELERNTGPEVSVSQRLGLSKRDRRVGSAMDDTDRRIGGVEA